MAKYEISGVGNESEDYSRVLRIIQGVLDQRDIRTFYEPERGIVTLLPDSEIDDKSLDCLRGVFSAHNSQPEFQERILSLKVIK